MVELVREDVAMDLESRLAKIDAAVSELLDLWNEGSERRDELGRELVEERAKNLDLQRRIVPAEKELESALSRVTALEAQLADLSADLAEREHQTIELQQGLRHERELRKRSEAERDRLRQLAGYLQKSRWRQLGKAIGVVKTAEWERTIGG
jgi:chromosome segregation ATPase